MKLYINGKEIKEDDVISDAHGEMYIFKCITATNKIYVKTVGSMGSIHAREFYPSVFNGIIK